MPMVHIYTHEGASRWYLVSINCRSVDGVKASSVGHAAGLAMIRNSWRDNDIVEIICAEDPEDERDCRRFRRQRNRQVRELRANCLREVSVFRRTGGKNDAVSR